MAFAGAGGKLITATDQPSSKVSFISRGDCNGSGGGGGGGRGQGGWKGEEIVSGHLGSFSKSRKFLCKPEERSRIPLVLGRSFKNGGSL